MNLEEWVCAFRALGKYILELLLCQLACMVLIFGGLLLYSNGGGNILVAYFSALPCAYFLHHYLHKGDVFFYANLHLSFLALRIVSLGVFVLTGIGLGWLFYASI